MFKVPKGEQLFELKRGFLSAEIIYILFSKNSTLIGVTSNHGTMHIFQLERVSQ